MVLAAIVMQHIRVCWHRKT